MPGRMLSQTEKRLKKWWNCGAATDFPLLEGFSIESTAHGLRGIQNIDIALAYPVTVIAGKNGAGKTTLLGLAALGFHGVPGHFPRSAKRQLKSGEGYSYYTFQDFFYRGPGDQDVSGLRISWRYRGADTLTISKQSDKWMRYERRPARPVHYFGISRAIPAIEQSVLRSHFGAHHRTRSTQLSEEAVGWVGAILQRQYQDAERLSSQRYGLRRCQTGGGFRYSSFNMGAGEDLLFDLIGTIDRAPDGSLILVEEIEVGIHAGAMHRLGEVLQEIAWKKKLQIIVSSHSEQFVDSLPREARILLRKEGARHRAFQCVSTGFIFSDLSGRATCELKIFCEDQFARRFIESALDADLRPRVSVNSVGDKATVAEVAAIHIWSRERTPCLVIWDGDVPEAEAVGMMTTSAARHGNAKFEFLRLPGDEPPERMVVRAVLSDVNAIDLFADRAHATQGSAQLALESALAETDHHKIPQVIARQLGVEENDVVNALTQAACRGKVVAVKHISDAIRAIL